MAAEDDGADPIVGPGPGPGELFELWRDMVTRTRVSEATSAHAESFHAELRRLELGPVTLMGTAFPSARFRRDERMVRRGDPEVFHLTLWQRGGAAMRLGRDQADTYRPGELTLIDSTRPYDVRIFGDRTPGQDAVRAEALGLDLPLDLLPIPRHRLRDLLGRPLQARQGSGALVADFLLSLDRRAPATDPAQAARLGLVAVDLIATWLAGEVDADGELPSEARHRALVERIRAFIRANLHDPDLTPSVVAAAHHISLSHLHQVFGQETGETVAAWIRQQRLQRAHRDLADPALRTTPIGAVAARWGFTRPDDFSRSFRAAYGLSPRDHRTQALSGAAARRTECQEAADSASTPTGPARLP